MSRPRKDGPSAVESYKLELRDAMLIPFGTAIDEFPAPLTNAVLRQRRVRGTIRGPWNRN